MRFAMDSARLLAKENGVDDALGELDFLGGVVKLRLESELLILRKLPGGFVLSWATRDVIVAKVIREVAVASVMTV